MENHFEISMKIKTAKGLETYGSFLLGSDQQFARHIFDLMQGDTEPSQSSVISMDLIRRENGIAYPVFVKHCNWEHLAYNTKIITKEVFKDLNLE